MSETLVISNVNEVYIHVSCSNGVAYELNDYFSFYADNYKFHPLYKSRVWNGKIQLFSLRTRQVYRGLVSKLREFCAMRGYTVEYPDETPDAEFSVTEAREFISDIKPKHVPHDYQEKSFIHGIRKHRGCILSATGSGKSLAIYLFSRYFERKKLKGLVIVPRTSLVEQLYKDFEDYSSTNDWVTAHHCHRIYSGKEKNDSRSIYISTWQSLQNLPKSYFAQFDYVVVDEAHGGTAKTMTNILSAAVNAKYRIGLTGTLSDAVVNEFTLTGLLGPIYQATTSKELMDQGKLADLSIKCLLLKYPEEECKLLKDKKGSYADEIQYLVASNARNRFIKNLATSLDSNVLILFNYIEHGENLYSMIKSAVGNERKVYLIHGSVGVEEREQIRAIVEKEKSGFNLFFGKKKVFVERNEKVRLSDGTLKDAQEITTDDDICDDWLKTKII